MLLLHLCEEGNLAQNLHLTIVLFYSFVMSSLGIYNLNSLYPLELSKNTDPSIKDFLQYFLVCLLMNLDGFKSNDHKQVKNYRV